MGNAFFWYYGSSGGFTAVDLGGPVTQLFWDPIRMASSGQTVGGDLSRTSWSSALRVTISLGPFNATGPYDGLPEKLDTMSAHLERGGRVAFAADRDVALFGSLASPPTPGDLNLNYASNLMKAFHSTANVKAGESIVAVENDNPQGNREYHKVTGQIDNALVVLGSGGTVYDYDSSPSWVRERDTFPSLWLPDDQLNRSFLTNDFRITWALDITLVTDHATMAALAYGLGQVELMGEAGSFSPGGITEQGWTIDPPEPKAGRTTWGRR